VEKVVRKFINFLKIKEQKNAYLLITKKTKKIFSNNLMPNSQKIIFFSH